MYATALLMGLAGGLHCAGMCGPLVLAATSGNGFAGSKLVYNLGRIFTYGILGMLAGAVGGFFPFGQYQNVLAYTLGGILLLLGFGAINGVRIPLFTPMIYRFTSWIKKSFGVLLKGKRNLFFLGTVNGLLPCGLTYLALTYCFTLNNFQEGFLFMIIFGVGTIPVMLGLVWMAGLFFDKINLSHRKLSTIVLISIGCLVMVRTAILHNHDRASQNQEELVEGEVICR